MQDRLAHHSDRGKECLNIAYTKRLAETGIEPSVGSIGDSFDKALAKTINGLIEAEVIWPRRPRRSLDAGEFASIQRRMSKTANS